MRERECVCVREREREIVAVAVFYFYVRVITALLTVLVVAPFGRFCVAVTSMLSMFSL